jgi:hypothetical protein
MAGILNVSPVTNVISTGRVNGVFTNLSTTYTLVNTGDASLNYSVTNPEEYVSISNASGSLGISEEIDILIYLNNITLKNKNVGTYDSTITFTSSGDGSTTRSLSIIVNPIEPYSINFLPEALRTNDFFIWFCDLLDYVLISLKHTDDPLLNVPQEFIDLVNGAGDESKQEAILAYYNTMVTPNIGTSWLMNTLLLMFETPYTLKEWWESDYTVSGPGTAYRFKVITDDPEADLSVETKAKLLAIINRYKNERSILDGFTIKPTLTDQITDISMSDLSLSGNILKYEQYDGDDGGGAGSFTYDGSHTYGPISTTPFS